MNKLIATALLCYTISACALEPKPYERDFMPYEELQTWIKEADIHDLCFALKNWRNHNMQDMATEEFHRRGIKTKSCYKLVGYDLDP